MCKDLMAPTDWIQEYKTEPIHNLVFLVRLPGPNKDYRPLRDVAQMITKTSVDDIVDWHQLKPAPFPKSLLVNETKANRQGFQEIKALVEAGHSARAFIRDVPCTTCGQKEYVLAFGHIVAGRGTSRVPASSVHLPLAASPPSIPPQQQPPQQPPPEPSRRAIIRMTPTGKIDVSLKQDIVLPCGTISKLSTALLNVDCPKPQPYTTGVRPKWVHSIRLRQPKPEPFGGTIDMMQYPATPAFLMAHMDEMTSVEFPETVQIKPKRPNLVKLEKIRKRIQQKCFAQAFHHTWNRHRYLVLAFTDVNEVDGATAPMEVEEETEPSMQVQEETPTPVQEETTETPVQEETPTQVQEETQVQETTETPTPMQEPTTQVEEEPGATQEEPMQETNVQEDWKEVRKNLWLSVSRGNVFKSSRIRKLVPRSLLAEWHQYELKGIRFMPEFVAVHFHQLCS